MYDGLVVAYAQSSVRMKNSAKALAPSWVRARAAAG